MIPGPISGEGCSMEGGCANCPYMKMNTITALNYIIDNIDNKELLRPYEPKLNYDVNEGGNESFSIVDEGTEPIFHMLHFQKTGFLSNELIEKIKKRNLV